MRLWFWPLDRVLDLPTSVGLLASARLLLGAQPPKAELRSLMSSRLGFEIDGLLSAAEGLVPDTTLLSEVVPWFRVTHGLVSEQSFHHWEMVFPERWVRQRKEVGLIWSWGIRHGSESNGPTLRSSRKSTQCWEFATRQC